VLLQNADDLLVGKSRSLHCLASFPDNRLTSKRGQFSEHVTLTLRKRPLRGADTVAGRMDAISAGAAVAIQPLAVSRRIEEQAVAGRA
jgi:hypothetical protein